MTPKKKRQLEKQGWQIGSTQDFLELSDEEYAYIELKLMLGENLRQKIKEKPLTQVELSKKLRSNQSRIAKMEAGDPSVSLDLLIRSLLKLGTTRRDLARMISLQDQISAL